jgi:ADP-glucose pyrophosphorylase
MILFPVKIYASFVSSQKPELYAAATWLNPLLKTYAKSDNGKVFLTIYIFNRKLISKSFSHTKQKERSFNDYINKIKAVKTEEAKLQASYGFEDPSITGLIFGVIDVLSQSIRFDEYYNNADFSSDSTFFNIIVELKINTAVSLLRVLRKKLPYTNQHALNKVK